MSFDPKYTITRDILSNLAKIENVRDFFEHNAFSPSLMASLKSTAKIASVHYSTKIEGNKLTHQQVEDAILKRKKIPYRERDSSEVKAYYKAMDYIEKCLDKNLPFSEELIKKAHDIVEGCAYPYRDGQNAIYDNASGNIVYVPPEAKDVPFLMKDLVNWVNANTQIPHVIVSGLVHYQFVTIHPYYDGNGRTARLITSFLMRKYGYGLNGIYSLEEYYANDLVEYYDALATHEHHNYYEGRERADLTHWIDYFVRGVADAFKKIQAHKKTKSDVPSAIRKLDVRQRKTLELFAEFEEVSSMQIAEHLSISQQSGRLLANQWIETGFLKLSNSSKKARKYRLCEEYEKTFFDNSSGCSLK
ncbi:cell division protein Fic [Alphaproteobacteria bacterium]|nr:cell division protein Fic [Alphaproteobacteria bacterium]